MSSIVLDNFRECLKTGNNEGVMHIINNTNVSQEYVIKYTLMHVLVCFGIDRVRKYVPLLLEKGADINAESLKWTPISLAIKIEDVEVAEYLLDNGASLNVRPNHGDTCMSWACFNRDLPMIKLLHRHGCALDEYDECDVLHNFFQAGRLGDIEIIDYFLQNGQDINRLEYGQTILHMCCKNGYYETVKYLEKQGLNIYDNDAFNNTNLHLAAHGSNIDLIRYLVEDKGFNVNARNYKNETPLFFCFRLHGKKKRVSGILREYENFNYLIKFGADITVKKYNGKTLMDRAIKYYNTHLTECLEHNNIQTYRSVLHIEDHSYSKSITYESVNE